MAEASGCAIQLDEDALRTDALVAAALALSLDPVDRALHAGEDYALVVALPPDAATGQIRHPRLGRGSGPARRQ